MEKLILNNTAQFLDLLGARLAFERTGVKLYDTVIAKIEAGGEARYQRLCGELRHIRSEEKEHEEWLEAQIRALGGNTAESTAMSKLETEESSGIEHVIVDGHQKVLHLLHALLAAELADNAGWDLLVQLAGASGDRSAQLAFLKRLGEEVKHLAFIREAVMRAAQVDVLGRDRAMPESLRSVVAGSMLRPLAIGGLVFGTGMAFAAALLGRRRRGPAARLRAWRAKHA